MECKKCLTYAQCRNRLLDIYYSHDFYSLYGAYMEAIHKKCTISEIHRIVKEYNEECPRYKVRGFKLSVILCYTFDIKIKEVF